MKYVDVIKIRDPCSIAVAGTPASTWLSNARCEGVRLADPLLIAIPWYVPSGPNDNPS